MTTPLLLTTAPLTQQVTHSFNVDERRIHQVTALGLVFRTPSRP